LRAFRTDLAPRRGRGVGAGAGCSSPVGVLLLPVRLLSAALCYLPPPLGRVLDTTRDPMHRPRQHGIIVPVSAVVREVSCSLADR